MQTAYLILNTGDVLEGTFLNEATTIEGEVVFNTSMIGYQEVMTDPSYEGQLVTMTYPLIGNYGCNNDVKESLIYGAKALIVQTVSHHPDHPTSTHTLKQFAEKAQVPIIYNIDTRHLTKIIRTHPNVFGKISTDPTDHVTMTHIDPNVVKKVSVKKVQQYKASDADHPHVAVIDFGQKKSIVDALINTGANVSVCPYDTTKAELDQLGVDGVVLSNGPGDPADCLSLIPTVRSIADSYPTFGICLGHQLLALSYGMKTKKLVYGHRGGNHAVKSSITGKVYMTSQNHGYVVCEDAVTDDFDIIFTNVNDQSIEGLQHKTKPITSVQFHPEAHPGPTDTMFLIEQFVNQVEKKGAVVHA
jgi:carbamoyl-phosphate synthase small subunit